MILGMPKMKFGNFTTNKYHHFTIIMSFVSPFAIIKATCLTMLGKRALHKCQGEGAVQVPLSDRGRPDLSFTGFAVSMSEVVNPVF